MNPLNEPTEKTLNEPTEKMDSRKKCGKIYKGCFPMFSSEKTVCPVWPHVGVESSHSLHRRHPEQWDHLLYRHRVCG